jgi:Arc/MetJ-type ribon-helix-helix transcriptional regulator
MSTGLSPENELFIQQAVAAGVFSDREHALDEAVGLLKSRQGILAHIDEGTRQLREGDCVEFDQDGLRKFFDEIQERGRRRYEESRKPT